MHWNTELHKWGIIFTTYDVCNNGEFYANLITHLSKHNNLGGKCFINSNLGQVRRPSKRPVSFQKWKKRWKRKTENNFLVVIFLKKEPVFLDSKKLLNKQNFLVCIATKIKWFLKLTSSHSYIFDIFPLK